MALNQKQKSPWAWIPTLYIAEGLPNVIVTAVAVVLYMQMGLTDGEIGLYTGWLGLPWIIKPLWSPFVDLVKTKRWWILLTQVLLGSSLAGIAFTLRTDFWFQGTMFCFFLPGVMYILCTVFILHRRILVTSVMRGMRKTNLSSSWVTILR